MSFLILWRAKMRVIKKEIDDIKWRFIIIGGILILAFLIVKEGQYFLSYITFPTFSFLKNSVLGKIIKPEIFLREIELMKKSKDYYIWSQWYGKNLYEFIVLATILYGFSSFAREIERKTIYYLLSFLSRGKVFFGKSLVGICTLFLTVFMGGMLPLFLGFKFFMALKLTISLFLVSLFLYMIVLFFSITTGDDVKTLIWSLAIFFILGIPGFFRQISYLDLYKYMKGIDIFIKHSFPWESIGIIFSLSIIIFFVNFKIFLNKDF